MFGREKIKERKKKGENNLLFYYWKYINEIKKY